MTLLSLTTTMHPCYLSLGSNVTNDMGTPSQHLLKAIERLKKHPQIDAVIPSSFYISEPYGVTDQADFLNAVIKCKTSLEPEALLLFCQSLEIQAKRQRLRHWGERSLDVDILLVGDRSISTPTLTIPHHELTKRNFVLVPLLEVAPDLMLLGKEIIDYPLSSDWTGLKRLD